MQLLHSHEAAGGCRCCTRTRKPLVDAGAALEHRTCQAEVDATLNAWSYAVPSNGPIDIRADVRPDTVLTSQSYVAGQLSDGSAGEVPPPCLRHSLT